MAILQSVSLLQAISIALWCILKLEALSSLSSPRLSATIDRHVNESHYSSAYLSGEKRTRPASPSPECESMWESLLGISPASARPVLTQIYIKVVSECRNHQFRQPDSHQLLELSTSTKQLLKEHYNCYTGNVVTCKMFDCPNLE